MVVSAPLLLAALPLTTLAPQGPDEVLANYVLAGKPAVVTRIDVALEMAFHNRRRERGQQACEQLVATTLTRDAAAKKNLQPTDAEIRAFWQQLQQQFRDAGQSLADFPAVKNASEQQLFDDLAVQLMQQRLVRAELGLDAKAHVSGDMLQLWLQEEKKQHTIVVEADNLPAGTAVRVGATEVPLIDLGLLLLRTAEDEEREKFVKQVAYLNSLEDLARKANIVVTPSDLDVAVKGRTDEWARDPRSSGVTFDNMLKSLGLTVGSLRELRTFRAGILLDKLAARRVLEPDLVAELAKDRQGVLDRVGPRRRIGLIFLRAIDVPNGLITRTFDDAQKHLEGVRTRLDKEKFELVARIESEHVSTKQQGGDAGSHRRRSDRLPDTILAAAFALRAGEVSMPVRTEDGVCLVKALEVEPEPDDATLVKRLREWHTQELEKQVLTDAKVELVKADTGKKGVTK